MKGNEGEGSGMKGRGVEGMGGEGSYEYSGKTPCQKKQSQIKRYLNNHQKKHKKNQKIGALRETVSYPSVVRRSMSRDTAHVRST